jgi:thiamine biosynthesis lipoprotein
MKVRILLAASGLVLVLLFLPRADVAVPFVEAHLAMGTVITLKLYVEEEEGRPLASLAFAEIDRIDSLMSHYSATSELSRVNSLAAAQGVKCSAELSTVLERSLYFARRSQGAFDITVGALTNLWHIPDALSPPPAAALDSALALVGCEYLQLQDHQVRLLTQGVRLDLGAAAKGFAVDQAVAALRAAGASSGLITAGGDIRFWGEKPDGRPWRFGVQHPRDPDQLVEIENLDLAALATSGDYQQFFIYEGERFHHLLDPRTGYPARAAVSATAWARTAMDADILSTAVFVLGPEQGINWIESLPDTEALVFFERDGQLDYRASSGVAKNLRFMEKADINSSF